MKWLVLDVENASYELYSTHEQAEKAADDRKSTAEHVLFLLAKDIMQNS